MHRKRVKSFFFRTAFLKIVYTYFIVQHRLYHAICKNTFLGFDKKHVLGPLNKIH